LKNREPWKGVAIATALFAASALAAWSRMLLTFIGMVFFLAGTWLWRIQICVDAFRVARRGTQSKKSYQQARTSFAVSGLLIILCTVVPSTDYFLRSFKYFRAFKVPSGSMCPTICDGDRIVSNMYAYLKTPPQRDDLIMFDFHSEHRALYIKRVVGIGGDIVSEKDGVVLVNGKPIAARLHSPICGNSKAAAQPSSEDLPRFEPVTVPASSFFVVGDNSANSNDSRIPGFGFVTLDQIKGKPLYLYWSQDRSRIGCTVR
jgi:signal peptidase I